MRRFRHRKRVYFRGLRHKYGRIYQNSEGDEFKRIGKRRFIQISDVQMCWHRLSRMEIKERKRLNFINKILGIIFIGFIILIIWLISKFI